MPENQDEMKIKQMIDELVEKAKKASKEYLKLDQKTVDNITKVEIPSAKVGPKICGSNFIFFTFN